MGWRFIGILEKALCDIFWDRSVGQYCEKGHFDVVDSLMNGDPSWLAEHLGIYFAYIALSSQLQAAQTCKLEKTTRWQVEHPNPSQNVVSATNNWKSRRLQGQRVLNQLNSSLSFLRHETHHRRLQCFAIGRQSRIHSSLPIPVTPSRTLIIAALRSWVSPQPMLVRYRADVVSWFLVWFLSPFGRPSLHAKYTTGCGVRGWLFNYWISSGFCLDLIRSVAYRLWSLPIYFNPRSPVPSQFNAYNRHFIVLKL